MEYILRITTLRVNMFIIDFDDTLFDTRAFKTTRLEAMKGLGVSDELFWETYSEARKNSDGNYIYTDERHAEIIANHSFDKAKVLRLFKTVNEHLENYLFPDAVAFLKKIKENRQKMILLSLGDEGFQKLKVGGAGIKKYFDEIFTVNDTKEHVMREAIKKNAGEDIWFVNDKVDETKQLAKLFPELHPILRVSKSFAERDYIASGLPYLYSLLEIFQYVK